MLHSKLKTLDMLKTKAVPRQAVLRPIHTIKQNHAIVSPFVLLIIMRIPLQMARLTRHVKKNVSLSSSFDWFSYGGLQIFLLYVCSRK